MKQKLVKFIEDLIQRKSEDHEYWKNDENAKRLAFYIKQKPRISRVIDILSGVLYLLFSIILCLVLLHLLEGTYVYQGFQATAIIKSLSLMSAVVGFFVFLFRWRFGKKRYFSVETFCSSFFYSFILLVGYVDIEANIFIPLLLISLLKNLMCYLWRIIDYRERIADGRIRVAYLKSKK